MGGCVGTTRNNSPSQATTEVPSPAIRGETVGKNLPLRHEKFRWKSDKPLTEKQVQGKREEFWDTEPAFEGRREIWDALKAAAAAVEALDYDLAQAIIDGANITLPHGTLTDCYDELGTRYQLPLYCFSLPVNVIPARDKSASIQRGGRGACSTSKGVLQPLVPSRLAICHDELGEGEGEEVVLKIRLSTTSSDVKLQTWTATTIAGAKLQLQEQESLPEGARQRWYYGGKLLGDRLRVEQCSVPHNHVVQCIITTGEDF